MMGEKTWMDRLIEKKRLEREELAKHPKPKIKPPSKDSWIDAYFANLCIAVAYHRSQPLIGSKSEIKKQDLEVSLKMFLQEAAFYAYDWTDVNRKYDDRRSFPRFLKLLKMSGLDNYASNEGNVIVISNPSDKWLLLEAWAPDAVVTADKFYEGSLWLMKLLQRIRKESGDDFRQEQALLLESFLDHLIKMQLEQRIVAHSLSVHLEKLRNPDAVPFSSNAVDAADGKCPLVHTVHSYVWRQKHLFDSLCNMSRESAWLLKKLKDSHFSSPSSSEECNKILDIILVFIPKFEESKELLDQYLHGEAFHHPVNPIPLVADTNIVLEAFGGRIKSLLQQGIERESSVETLLTCFLDVVIMSGKLGYPHRDNRSSLQRAFAEAAMETSELINEAVEKLNLVSSSDLSGGGSPLGCIALWRIIFESSLINLRLDCICENYTETIKLWVKLLDIATKNQVDQIRMSINQLLSVGESVLVQFIDMHKTVAEVTYTLGDAFTTGGAGMRGSSELRHPRTFKWLLGKAPYTLGGGKQDEQVMNFNLEDFPWDKHSVHDYYSRTSPTSEDQVF